MTFRLRDGIDEADMLAADKRVQEEFAPFQYGFVRRTTARGADDTWIVVTLWYEIDNARAAADQRDDVKDAFLALIDDVEIAHYETLD